MTCFLLDNGAGNIKFGVSDQDCLGVPQILPNAIAKLNKTMDSYIADQITSYYNTRNTSLLQFHRPSERGYVINWATEIEVWNYIFNNFNHSNSRIEDSSLILTEPICNPATLQNDLNEIILEYFNFNQYMRRPSACFSAYESAHLQNNSYDDNTQNDPIEYDNLIVPTCSSDNCVIVESGFSFTHIIPFINGKCQKHAIKRVNIGGKLLTNYLKEMVSFRQWNMMDESLLINQVKEELCYVSTDFLFDLKNSKNNPNYCDPFNGKLKRQFVLPDYHKIMKGYVRQEDEMLTSDDQVLMMESERFSVPELLFNPNDIGIEQAGIAEATWQSLQSLHTAEMGLAVSNIVLTGGNACFPQIENRFEQELRSFIPSLFPMKVSKPHRPDLFAWQGMNRFAANHMRNSTLYDVMISRSDYLEYGHHYCNKHFESSW
eukprot:gene7849-10657_t